MCPRPHSQEGVEQGRGRGLADSKQHPLIHVLASQNSPVIVYSC